MSEKLKDKVAIITGASSGIGKATAKKLAEEGTDLVLIARNMNNLKAVQKELLEYGTNIFLIATDISDREQIKQAVKEVVERLNKIDILVCSAGQYHRCPIADLKIKDIENQMKVNFYGTLNCIYEVLPHMTERKSGNIVVVSSVDGKKGLPLDGAYVASKFALAGFIDVLRQEARVTGVKISTVFPGRVDTGLISNISVPWISAKIPAERVAKAIYRTIAKNKGEVLVPYFTSKLLVVLNSISYRIGDFVIRMFRLEGKEEG